MLGKIERLRHFTRVESVARLHRIGHLSVKDDMDGLVEAATLIRTRKTRSQ
ncbi:MAG: hypothetical protein ABJA02_09480 [Acidobacteriota bacterium]